MKPVRPSISSDSNGFRGESGMASNWFWTTPNFSPYWKRSSTWAVTQIAETIKINTI